MSDEFSTIDVHVQMPVNASASEIAQGTIAQVAAAPGMTQAHLLGFLEGFGAGFASAAVSAIGHDGTIGLLDRIIDAVKAARAQ